MSPRNMLKRHEQTAAHWSTFVQGGALAPGALRPVIAESWNRCRTLGLDPHGPLPESELTGESLQDALNLAAPMLSVAGPFMNALYATVGSQDLIVRLADADGWVLECFGDPTVLRSNGALSLYRGTSLREEQIGTNAVSLALMTRQPQQVFGAEHYHSAFHQWASSAAPIRGEDGRAVGALSISGPSQKVHSHTLGMVMAAALAIEHELKLNAVNRELTRRNEHLSTLMESISEGILSVDRSGTIQDFNGKARSLLGHGRKSLLGLQLDSLLEEPLMDRLRSVADLDEDLEIEFRSRTSQKSLILNASPVRVRDRQVQEYLLTFKETRRIYSQASRIVGARAIYTFDDILGASPAIHAALTRARLVSDTDVTVLLTGESGTGKELFAQSIHNASPRRSQPFVFINCGAIPRDLVASELFGYVEGAFTGARRGGQPGKFELAEGGTLFLDEIGDMPLDTQATLLRVLETKQVVRVGGYEVIPVDVRVLAASHKDLAQEAARGTFRADLFYRLNVVPIRTPSLRERQDDIPLLVDFFYRQFTRHPEKRPPIDDSFYHVMQRYPWPGNVRELQNIMQMVTNLVEPGTRLNSHHLPAELKGLPTRREEPLPRTIRPASVVEQEMLEDALRATEGNLVKAAALLEIGRSTLYRKIEKYQITY